MESNFEPVIARGYGAEIGKKENRSRNKLESQWKKLLCRERGFIYVLRATAEKNGVQTILEG